MGRPPDALPASGAGWWRTRRLAPGPRSRCPRLALRHRAHVTPLAARPGRARAGPPNSRRPALRAPRSLPAALDSTSSTGWRAEASRSWARPTTPCGRHSRRSRWGVLLLDGAADAPACGRLRPASPPALLGVAGHTLQERIRRALVTATATVRAARDPGRLAGAAPAGAHSAGASSGPPTPPPRTTLQRGARARAGGGASPTSTWRRRARWAPATKPPSTTSSWPPARWPWGPSCAGVATGAPSCA